MKKKKAERPGCTVGFLAKTGLCMALLYVLERAHRILYRKEMPYRPF